MQNYTIPSDTHPLRQRLPEQEAEPKKKDGGMMSGMMGGGMMAMSDEHSKKEIQRLSSTNDALMKALDHSAANTGGNMPETEYPRMPAHTNFADTPQANKVAAQNVGIQAASAPPPQAAPQGQQPMQMDPQQQNFTRSQNPAFAFNPNQGMPDMSALDEAYKRQSQGG